MAVTASHHTARAAEISDAIHRAFSAVAHRMSEHRQAVRRRKALASLLTLSPEQLEDVGLTVEDLQYGLSQPLHVNGARAASQRARRRRNEASVAMDRRRAELAAAYRARRGWDEV